MTQAAPPVEQVLSKLLTFIKQLRDPSNGCPWTKNLQLDDVKTYTIEETYEVIDAIEQRDFPALKKELGDLLYQIILYADIAERSQLFSLSDVIDALHQKLLQRQPVSHDEHTTPEAVNAYWQKRKKEERQHLHSILDPVEKNLAPIIQSQKLQQAAANVGFDWPDVAPIYEKIQEEIAEVKAAAEQSTTHLTDEIGDLLFSVINLARHYGINADLALHRSNEKFRHRFQHIETTLAKKNIDLDQATLEEMEALWQAAKKEAS